MIFPTNTLWMAGLLILLTLFPVVLAFLVLWKTNQRQREILAQGKDSRIALETKLSHTEQAIHAEVAGNRMETTANAKMAREELGRSLRESSDFFLQRMREHSGMQKDQLDSFARQLADLTRLNEEKLETIRRTLDYQLRLMLEENNKKLEEMKAVVDEQLHSTLEKRIGESFKQVGERLEQVHRGLGEMRSLANGVGDLKKVLTNVKTRGTWGEIRLAAILEQVLTPDQYATNVATKRTGAERVEFAIKLPGQSPEKESVVWMPIDSKFPLEDYHRLLDAQEAADREMAERSIKNLEARIKMEAKGIQEKYIDPPGTTDFAILFLPVEGLYAEVLRIPGLCDFLQRQHRVVVAGPTTLAALLNSLQMGFRTLAIEKRSSEVWELLGAVKTEFGKFGSVLARTKRKLQEASNSIDQAEMRTRVIERRLIKVQEIPESEPLEEIENEDAAPEDDDRPPPSAETLFIHAQQDNPEP